MSIETLMAISPLDGRYAAKTEALRNPCSEYGLMFWRLLVEIYWLKALASEPQIKEIPALSDKASQFLDDLYQNFSTNDAEAIKKIEMTTNHDVKAVEYFLKEKMTALPELNAIKEFVHFACTSEDINNLSYALMVKKLREAHLMPLMENIIAKLNDFAKATADIPMLARTHGQPASPTTVGKEFSVFVRRLERQLKAISKVEILGKMNGAVGNFNAHQLAYPEIDWIQLSSQFIESLEVKPNQHTTQIESHDYLAELFHAVSRFNSILIDFSRDTWGYISRDYFKQKSVEGEVGSSTMPHKVNPIDFENAEGNCHLANAIFTCLADKLLVSRWQRDLVDSTLLRNIGTAFGYCLVAYHSLLKGLDKLAINRDVISEDLAAHPAVLAEGIQTVMRRYGIEHPYEKLKALTRGKAIDAKALATFVSSLDLPDDAKATLEKLTPDQYIGLAKVLSQ